MWRNDQLGIYSDRPVSGSTGVRLGSKQEPAGSACPTHVQPSIRAQAAMCPIGRPPTIWPADSNCPGKRTFKILPKDVARPAFSRMVPQADRPVFSQPPIVTRGALPEAWELHSAKVSLLAMEFTSLDKFCVLLGHISKLPKGLQAEQLLMLGYRILRVGENKQIQAAADAFISAAERLDRGCLTETQPAALDGLLEAARAPRNSAPRPPEPQWSLACHITKTVAGEDVCRGEPIPVVAQRYGIHHLLGNLELRVRLEIRAADGRAGAEVARGESVEVVGQRYGIETDRGIGNLVIKACEGRAIQTALLAGRSLREIAQAHGIRTQVGQANLAQTAVRTVLTDKIRDGHFVDTIVKTYGLGDWPHEMMRLEDIAINGRAGHAVRRRLLVDVVAWRYGITTERGILALENIAIGAHAGEEVRTGRMPVDAAALRYGITTERGRFALENIAIAAYAGKQVRAGETAHSVATICGITTPSGLARLKELEEARSHCSIWKACWPLDRRR